MVLGRGYRLVGRTADAIRTDLTDAGCDPELAAAWALGAGLSGVAADKFIRKHRAGAHLPLAVEAALFARQWQRAQQFVIDWVAKELPPNRQHLPSPVEDVLVVRHTFSSVLSPCFGGRVHRVCVCPPLRTWRFVTRWAGCSTSWPTTYESKIGPLCLPWSRKIAAFGGTRSV